VASLLRYLSLVLLSLALLLAGVLLLVNTETGHGLVARMIVQAGDGRVRLSGLTGILPLAPRVARLELHDADGVWLEVEDAALEIDPRPLLRATLAIEVLSARAVMLSRLPAPGDRDAGAIGLPLPLWLQRLAIDTLHLDGALPGAPLLTLEGSGQAGGVGNLEAILLLSTRDRPDHYRLEIARARGREQLDLAMNETPGGLVAALATAAGVRVPTPLGAWRLDATADGPLTALALSAVLDAGPLQASVEGMVDLANRSTTGLRIAADLPAMAIAPGDAPGLAWGRASLTADLDGPLRRPHGSARIEVDHLDVGELAIEHLAAKGDGDASGLRFDATLTGMRAPTALPESMASVPLRVTGALDPSVPARPFRLDVAHPLLDLAMTGELTTRSAQASLSLPDLASVGALTGVSLAGAAKIDLTGALDGPPRLDATGELTLTRAPGPLVDLLGPEARLSLSAQRAGSAWQLAAARIQGAAIALSAQGRAERDALALDWSLDVGDLRALAPGWGGRVQARGAITGRPEAPELVADLSADADLGEAGRGRVAGRLSADLSAPAGSLDLQGAWAGQPVAIDMEGGRLANGDLNLSLGDSRWAGVAASGSLRLPSGAALPQGEVRLRAERLADLTPLLALTPLPASDKVLAGRLSAHVRLAETGVARIEAEGDGLALPGAIRVETLALRATVTEPLDIAKTEATLRLQGLAVRGIAGDLSLTALGNAAALDLTADTALETPTGPARMTAGARLDGPRRRLTIQHLEARAHDEPLRLLAPTTLDLADGVAVDRLRLALGAGGGRGSMEIAGRLAPALDCEASVADLSLDVLRRFATDLPLAGSLSVQARLAGAPSRAVGNIGLQVEDLRLTEGAGRSAPPARITASVDLGSDVARIDARAETGPKAALRLHGRIGRQSPIGRAGLDLRADGRIDLDLLDPLLTSGGRQVSGQTVLATAIGGTWAEPRLDGRLRLDAATWRDRTIGLALTEISGALALFGETMRIDQLTARAGQGKVTVNGSVGLLSTDLPMDLRLVARDAQPIQSDRLAIEGDADVRLHGQAAGRLDAEGAVRLKRVEIRLPERLPASLATLEVRERGERRQPSRGQRNAGPRWQPDVQLDLRVSAPSAIDVQGRGVHAELGGEVQLRGPLAALDATGGVNLVRGHYELAGQALRFSRGRLDFDGAAVLDPSLDLEARASVSGSTAILSVLGTASAPRIELRGEPEMPQDEVLSRLLFGVAGGRLSPLQATRLGLAAASISGIGGGKGVGLLDRARTGLGLERLSIGTDERGESRIESGRNLSERVYLGARQGTRAGEPQGVLRIDATRNITLEADVGTSGGTRAGAAFEHEY
jgi:translocation and assembly module TamB